MGNVKRQVEGSEVILGGHNNGKKKQRNPGITPIDYWEKDFEDIPFFSNIEKIIEFPPTSDMAGVLARANFKNDRQRVAAVRLAYKNRKFNDNSHQEMLRDHCASTLGMGGLGKLLQTFIGTNLLAPDMFRAALGMQRTKHREEVHRGSDFRTQTDREKEVGNE